MKKILGLIAAGLLAFGAFGGVSFAADACSNPVSLDCDADGDGSADCDVFVLDNCINA